MKSTNELRAASEEFNSHAQLQWLLEMKAFYFSHFLSFTCGVRLTLKKT
jgi:hypothetical protein